MSITNRYEFVLLFDVKDGNPNGDPDAGNLPRLDTETGQGLVTDVSIKRKIRNYVGIIKGREDGSFEPGYDIYIKEKAVLGRAHTAAFKALGIDLGQDAEHLIPEDLVEQFDDLDLPAGMELDTDDDDRPILRLAAVLDKKEATDWLKETKPPKPVKDFIGKAVKNVKARKPNQGETERGRVQMCSDFYDIRTFGAVLSLKTAPNCGQVRGPVQLTFARSLDPIVTLEHSITRCAVATEAESTKQSGDNRTMGRKFTVPYGLYRAHGFISAHFAAQTKFSKDDLKLLWDALITMFDHDHSAARGEMATRGLYVFKHDSHLGSAPAHKLFDLIQIARKDPGTPARSFADYAVTAPPAGRLDAFPGVDLKIIV
ncbi:CRISPR-associated protein, Csd2 family [Thiocapsa sp. KS1]|nr:type I-C CRISPR-associated protein Cas7/Csd2 [Thiocapsa sp. KS1]CRI64004.1 CRISPR-associated protein, Csd2 family [Thiocapsa sp. KS1]